MRPADKPRREGREPTDAADSDAGSTKSPDTDMQPEDAGSAASVNAGRGASPAEKAMKQTSKTGNERPSRG